MNGITLTRVCMSAETCWKISTHLETACGFLWGASCSRGQRSCPGPSPLAALVGSGECERVLELQMC